jgi:hypothetical protein
MSNAANNILHERQAQVKKFVATILTGADKGKGRGNWIYWGVIVGNGVQRV